MKPILFNTEMVKAILEGRKVATRRPIKPQPTGKVYHYVGYKTDYWGEERETSTGTYVSQMKPPYQRGDILYVKETWAKDPFGCGFIYRANHHGAGQKWTPSIFMPKEAARIFLRVKACRPERLRDMVFADMLMEGVAEGDSYEDAWHDLWDSTIAPADLPIYGWEANPWVWAIYFEPCGKPEEAL